jgi:alkylated DNA repair dioxygenase AlkB
VQEPPAIARKAEFGRSAMTMAPPTSQLSIEKIEPGLVIIRNFIDDTECQRLADMALGMGTQDGEDGFFTKDKSGEKSLNTGEARGRIYDNANRFPPRMIAHAADAVSIAREVDPAMPNMTCTHLLLNMYTSASGLKWHRDIYENDGKSDHPVVNLCIGAACRFGIKHNDDDPERVLILRSGDCLLFGGPCRFIKHAVLDVLLDQIPSWMAVDSPIRFSFTFRDAPEVIGREHEFKYFKISENLVGQEDFDVSPKRSSLPPLLATSAA